MRAMAIQGFGRPDKLEAADLPRPRPARGEILLRVVAAGVNPVDWKICEGRLKDLFPHRFPLVPGWDVAGVVEELGEGASRFRKGDRVWAYARKPTVQWGCYAEYVTLPEVHVSLMPVKLLFEEAAAVPLAALTAWQCLERADAGRGSTVLVHAAGGGVGHFAVQLAHQRGARVLGTASAAKHAFVASLGAEAVIDYTARDFAEEVQRCCADGVDVVLDAVGGETLARSLAVVKPGGVIVGIVGRPDAEAAAERKVRAEYVFVEPNADQLKTLARMVDRKQLRPHVQKIHRLDQAAEALAVSREGHVQGKLVLGL